MEFRYAELSTDQNRMSFKPKINQSIYLENSHEKKMGDLDKKKEDVISVETSVPVTNRMNSIFKL